MLHPSRKLLSCILMGSALSVAGCAATDLGTRTAGVKTQDKSSSEASFQFESDKIEKKVAKSGARIRDAALNSYVSGLVDDLSGDYKGELRVYLLEAPVFNAGIWPNGAMVVYSGLMLRAKSEAEIALVLAHEFGHYYQKHSLEQQVAAKNATVGNLIFTVGTLGYGGLFGLLAAYGGLMSFSREQELEADKVGLKTVGEAGYDTMSAISLWENLAEEKAASSIKKVRKRSARSSIFDTHPASTERLKKLQIDAASWSGTKLEKEKYRNLIRPHLKSWLKAELGLRDAGSTLNIIDRLAKDGTDLGVLEYSRGRVYDFRGEDGDQELALTHYQNAVKHADAPVETWREIGDIHNSIGENGKAVKAFQEYLNRAPQAGDAAIIKNMIKTLQG